MNSIPWSPVLRYATPPDEQDPRFDRRRSVSSVLRYATPLPINRTPVSTVGGPFPPFCGTPHPSRSTGPRSERSRSVSSFLRYARPRFHRLFRPSPPDEHDHAFRSDPAGWLPRVPLPPDEHDAFRCLPMNTSIPLPPHEHDAFHCLPMNTTTTLFLHSDPTMYRALAVRMRE